MLCNLLKFEAKHVSGSFPLVVLRELFIIYLAVGEKKVRFKCSRLEF